MRIALCTISAGAPQALAATAFVASFAEGLSEHGESVRIVSLNQPGEPWSSESLGFAEVSTPWIDAPTFGGRDLCAAARADLWQEPPTLKGSVLPEWYREVLLERDLRTIPGDGPGVVMVYPRSLALLETVARVTRRMGWGLLIAATEALTDQQIDPAEREGYIQRVVSDADYVWAVSEHLARFWETCGVSPSRIVISPPPVRRWFFAQAEQPDAPDIPALYIGNLAHREIDYLLQIAGSVRARVSGFELVIHGDATAEQHERLLAGIASAGLQGVVHLKPPVLARDLPGLLRSARVLLLPRARGDFSTAGFPNKLGEYLSSGRPVVVTGVGDIPRHLVDGESALLVEPDDQVGFARAVVRLLEDDGLAQRVGHAGRQVALGVSRSDVVAGKVLTLIGSAPPRRPAGRLSSTRGWLMLGASLLRGAETSFKRPVVRALRALRLKSPAPPD